MRDRAEYLQKWRAENPDKVKAAQRKYYIASRDKRIAYSRRWRSENADKARATNRAIKLRKAYGISPGNYMEMFTSQSGLCAICGLSSGDRRLDVDHSHQTGAVRQLLCKHCNTGIGKFRESPEILLKAIEYLRRHSQ